LVLEKFQSGISNIFADLACAAARSQQSSYNSDKEATTNT